MNQRMSDHRTCVLLQVTRLCISLGKSDAAAYAQLGSPLVHTAGNYLPVLVLPATQGIVLQELNSFVSLKQDMPQKDKDPTCRHLINNATVETGCKA